MVRLKSMMYQIQEKSKSKKKYIYSSDIHSNSLIGIFIDADTNCFDP